MTKFTNEEARGLVGAYAKAEEKRKRHNLQHSIASWAGTALAVVLVAFIIVLLLWGIVAIGAAMRDLVAI